MKESVLIMVMLLCCTIVVAQEKVIGRVLDQSTQLPLEGATIQCSNQTTSSDSQGYFVLSGSQLINKNLNISFLGYDPWKSIISSTKEDTLTALLVPMAYMTDEVVVTATRASTTAPFTFTEVPMKKIKDNNLGKDLPYILEMTPSVVTTSDAGTGIGYTGIRIRGSDATRVNVTLNGIPYNDSESQGVFWVDLPDMASSIESIQVQRGVGTSTNGPGAFGASINIQTTGLNKNAYGSIDNSFGSFASRKHTVAFGTGLVNKKFTLDGRLSQIASDGYIDRSTADLNSFYVSAGYYGPKSLLKLNVFSGKEITYQSWYGTPESRVKNDVPGMQEFIVNNGLDPEEADNLLNSGRRYNFYTYKNQVDNYRQTHYQLLSAFDLNSQLTWNTALHFTHGQGYFEEFKKNQSLSNYGITGPTVGTTTVSTSNLVRRRWLDNDFYGFTYSLDYHPIRSLSLLWGGAWNRYDGDHFGEVVWARFAGNYNFGDHYYDNNGLKDDFTTYVKGTWQLSRRFSIYGDLQYRHISYRLQGKDNDLVPFDENHSYGFFNPKIGGSYQLSAASRFYISFAVGSKEPSRSDFIDTKDTATPKAEHLRNLELGYQYSSLKYNFNVNYYLMDYKNQLVLTGELNDVGAPLRTNVEDSYRTGLELSSQLNMNSWLHVAGNLTLSKNIINKYSEVLYNYGINWDKYNREETVLKNSDISFSPDIIAGATFQLIPAKGLDIRWVHRYIGEQFLDNTSNESRKIDAYYLSDLLINYHLKALGLKDLHFKLGVFNLFSTKYSSNGYTFGYKGGGTEFRENFFYPQAGRHFMAGLGLYF